MQRHVTDLKLRKASRVLEVAFDDGASFSLPFEYLRVYSPSAEVTGHSAAGTVLQVGKEKVDITGVEPIGNYAVRLIFDDGHNTGLYSWDVLYELGTNQETNWREYLQRLAEAGHERSAQ